MLVKMVHECTDNESMPDIYGFNSLITTWAKSGHKVAPEKAEELFALIESLQSIGVCNLKPNKFTYSAMISALSKSETVVKAQKFFDKIKPEIRDTFIFNAMLTAWAKSNDIHRYRKCHEILMLMIKEQKASIISYNCVLNSCAHYKGDATNHKDAFDVAAQAYDDLKKNFIPDEISFISFIKASTRLITLQKEKENVLKYILQDCCKYDLFSDEILRELKYVLPSDIYMNILNHNLEEK